MPNENEHGFLDLLAAGDSECLERVLESMRLKLMRIVAKRIPSKLNRRVDPEDIVQESLISFTLGVQEGSYQFGDWDDVEHLLVTITLNKLRRACRHEHAATRDVDCEDSAIENVPQAPGRREAVDTSSDPLELVVSSDLLRAVLEQLPERDREILHLSMMGHTIEEIAKRTGCGKRHVDQVLAKARRRLAKLEKED